MIREDTEDDRSEDRRCLNRCKKQNDLACVKVERANCKDGCEHDHRVDAVDEHKIGEKKPPDVPILSDVPESRCYTVEANLEIRLIAPQRGPVIVEPQEE